MARQTMATRDGRRRRRGTAFIWLIVSFAAFMGLASLAVDWGRVQLVKTELQRATDAAVLYAAQVWARGGTTTAVGAAAVAAAADNNADGKPVVLVASRDVEFGTWNATAKTFTVRTGALAAKGNAVRVYGRRSSESSDPVKLQFATVLGVSTFDGRAHRTSMLIRAGGSPDFGIVGLDSVKLNGSVYTDSYNSFTSATGLEHGSVASNGTMDLVGSVEIHGDARPGVSSSIAMGANVLVTGSTARLDTPLSWTTPVAGATNNAPLLANPAISPYINGADLEIGNNKSVTLPAGTYLFRDLKLSGGGTLNTTGPVTIYVTRNVDLGGNTNATGSARPSDLKVRVTGTGNVTLSGTTDMVVDLVAPSAEMKINGNPNVYGRLIGKTLDVMGNPRLHYDETLGAGNGGLSTVVGTKMVQ